MTEIKNVDSIMKALSSKAEEWYNMEASKKLAYLDYALESFCSAEELLLECAGFSAEHVKKVAPGSSEYQYLQAEDNAFLVAGTKSTLSGFREAFRLRAGLSRNEATLTNLKTRTTADGHVAAKVFPLLTEDLFGAGALSTGEVWFQRDKVATPSDVQVLEYKALQHSEPAVSVVLGAGNYPNLTVVDTLVQLFQKNTVVFLKQHELRPSNEKLMRCIFKPLYDDGFLYSEVHLTRPRCEQIVYHPLVKLVHMTGGKPTHDAIVWGNSEPRKLKLTNAVMSSELGAVTPFIVAPTNYTQSQLRHQAQVLLSIKFFNGGASCNAPQVVVMSDSWKQKDDFAKLLEEEWAKIPAPIAFYPGSKERWQACYDAYPEEARTTWMGRMPTEKSEANHMPLLVIQFEADLTTEEGRQNLTKNNYVLKNEAFGPVLALVTLKNTSGPQDFFEQAVPFCNDHLFGTLSCQLMMPPSMLKQNAYAEKAIGDLRYGAVAVNYWSALVYSVPYATWGAAPGEDLANVQSGIGFVNNVLCLQHVEKSVIVKPLVDPSNMLPTLPRGQLTQIFRAFARMLLGANLKTVSNVILALAGREGQMAMFGVLVVLVSVMIAYLVQS